MTILVLGVGNILLTDEGVGVRVVEALERRYQIPEGVTVMDGGTAGMELIASIAECDHLILVDAVNFIIGTLYHFKAIFDGHDAILGLEPRVTANTAFQSTKA